jgi:hypothetical protein
MRNVFYGLEFLENQARFPTLAIRVRWQWQGEVEMNIHQEAAKNATTDDVNEFSERRLWSAVLLQALEDWSSMNSRHRDEAERFFFKNTEDFARVCRGAGLVPSGVRARLEKMKAAAPKRRSLEYMFHGTTPQAA